MRRLPRLELRDGDRSVLEARAASTDVPSRIAQRAQVVLLAADGMSNCDISAKVTMHWNRVAVWRRRYAQDGLAGLEDESRSGRPPVYGFDDILLMLRIVGERPPAPLARWTVDAIAAQMTANGVPISSSQTWRICTTLDLKPWESDGWQLARTAGAWARVTDIEGLFMRDGIAACIFSVDDHAIVDEAELLLDDSTGDIDLPVLSAPRGAVQLADVLAHIGDGDACSLEEFLTRIVEGTPATVTLHCVTDGPATLTADELGRLSDRIEVHAASTRRTWLNRIALMIAAVEKDMIASDELDQAGTLSAEIEHLIKAYARNGKPLSWSASRRRRFAKIC